MTLVANAPVITPPIAQFPFVQLEEIKDIKPVRKKRAPKHDFRDGNGKVFAHKHDNGKGWVADTAHVADSVYVGSRCAVYQCARIVGTCRLKGRVRVHGHAAISGSVTLNKDVNVFGRAAVCDTAQLHDNAQVSGQARVCGGSHLYGSTVVRDHAYVLGSCLSGSVLLSGDTTVIRSNFTGEITVSGSATAVNATLIGRISLRDFCQILNSTVNFRVQGGESFTACDYAIIADNSHIALPLLVKNHAILVRVNANAYDWHGQLTPTFDTSVVATNRRFNSYNDIVVFLQQFANRGNNMYTPAPTPGPSRAPVNVQPSLRRVMRLETAES